MTSALYKLAALPAFFLFIAAGTVLAQAPQVSTLGGGVLGLDSTYGAAQFRSPFGIIRSQRTGEIYVSDEGNLNIRVLRDGKTTTLAGSTARQGGITDGVGQAARFTGPRGLALNTNGDTLFVADHSVNRDDRLRGIVLAGPDSGKVFTIAGNTGGNPNPSNGVGSAVRLQGLTHLAYRDGFVFMTEEINQAGYIRAARVSSREVRTLSDSGFTLRIQSAKDFGQPQGLALVPGVDSTYLVVNGFNSIQKVSLATGRADTLAGTGVEGNTNNIGRLASFKPASGIVLDFGSLYIADYANQTIRRLVLSTRAVTTLAGGLTNNGAYLDGVGSIARFNQPRQLLLIDTTLLVADQGNRRIRQIGTASRRVTTLAGSRNLLDGPARLSSFGGGGLAFYKNSQYIIADAPNHVIRLYNTRTNTVTTIAGNGSSGAGADTGRGPSVQFTSPSDIELKGDSAFICDGAQNGRVRVMHIPSGFVRTLVRNVPVSKLIQYRDTLMVLVDAGGNRLRTYNRRTGVVAVLAGTGGTATTNGPGNVAQLRAPSDGSVFRDTLIVSTGAGGGLHNIRSIALTGDSVGRVYTRIPQPILGLNNNRDLIIDRQGTLYVNNQAYNNGFRLYNLVTNTLPTVNKFLAGVGSAVDGAITTARSGRTIAFAFDSLQNTLIFIDGDNGVIRQISPLYSIINRAPTFARRSGNIPGLTDSPLREDGGSYGVVSFVTNVSANASTFEAVQNQTVSFVVRVSRPDLFSVQPTISLADSGRLTFTPAPDSNGVATITIIARDNGGVIGGGVDSAVAQAFTITVSPVNDAPIVGPVSDITTQPTPATARTYPNAAGIVQAGPRNERAQTLTFTLTNDNNGLFSRQPSLSVDRLSGATSLVFTPAGGSGVAVIRARLKDNGGVLFGGVDTAVTTFRIVLDPTGLSKTAGQSQYAIYPNPSQGSFTLRIKDAALPSVEVSLHDLLGRSLERRIVDCSSGTAHAQFSLADEPAGIYFVKVRQGLHTEVIKLQHTR